MGSWWAKRSTDEYYDGEEDFYLKKRKMGASNSQLYFYSSVTQFWAKKGGNSPLKDTIVISWNKRRIYFEYMFPWIINNSPINHNEEMFVLLHQSSKLRNTNIKHFQNILSNKDSEKVDYKFINFDLMGTEHEAWGEQLTNDLENLLVNEGLQIIGWFSSINNLSEYSLVMYRMSESIKRTKFDLEVKLFYNEIESESFEEYLNKEFKENKLIYRWILTIYHLDRETIIEGKTRVFMNLVVFQNLSINYPSFSKKLKFSVMNIPGFNKNKTDPEIALLNTIESESNENNSELLGVITNNTVKDSLMIFCHL